MVKRIGMLTAGSDCPGLNAAIRGFGKAARGTHGMSLVGFRDGFRGMIENRVVNLGGDDLSNILQQVGRSLAQAEMFPMHLMKMVRWLTRPAWSWMFTKNINWMDWFALVDKKPRQLPFIYNKQD